MKKGKEPSLESPKWRNDLNTLGSCPPQCFAKRPFLSSLVSACGIPVATNPMAQLFCSSCRRSVAVVNRDKSFPLLSLPLCARTNMARPPKKRRGRLREHQLMTSAEILDFLTPSPLSGFGTDLYYKIHAAYVYVCFSMTPLTPMVTSFLDAP